MPKIALSQPAFCDIIIKSDENKYFLLFNANLLKELIHSTALNFENIAHNMWETQQMQRGFEPRIFAHSLSTICGFKIALCFRLERYFRQPLNNKLIGDDWNEYYYKTINHPYKFYHCMASNANPKTTIQSPLYKRWRKCLWPIWVRLSYQCN